MLDLRRLSSLLVLLAAVATVSCAGDRDAFSIDWNDPLVVRHAELAIVESETPPEPGAAWRPIALPDSWRNPERYAQGREGWYRFRLQGPAPAEPHVLYLWRYSMNAAVWFNGEKLADGGSFEEPVARNWNRPMLVALPTSAWRSGSNELMVRLRVYPGFGQLLPPAIGPARVLAPAHEQRLFAQVTLSQVAAVVMALGVVAGLVLWFVDQREPVYLCFAALCATLVVYSANKFVRDTPVPARAWWWLVHASIDAANVLLFAFVHRALGVARPRLERALSLCLIASASLYAAWNLPQLARWNPLVHGVFYGAHAYLVGWLVARWLRRREREAALYAGVMLTLLVAGGHDALLNANVFPDLWREGTYVLTLAMPAILFGLMLHLALRSLRAAQGLRVANETLEARVRDASAEIEATYARERRLLAERSAGEERERIYRDLHDNLGARLLNLVHGAGDERQRAQARDALAEMRTIVATSQVAAANLADLAEEWRLEAELRCENAGLGLAWSRDGDARLSGRQRYQLERIVRELVSNAIEHSGGGAVDVGWRVDADVLELAVADDGRGMPDGATPASVTARAADLRGAARWRNADGGGTVATVTVPLAAPAASQSTGATPIDAPAPP